MENPAIWQLAYIFFWVVYTNYYKFSNCVNASRKYKTFHAVLKSIFLTFNDAKFNVSFKSRDGEREREGEMLSFWSKRNNDAKFWKIKKIHFCAEQIFIFNYFSFIFALKYALKLSDMSRDWGRERDERWGGAWLFIIWLSVSVSVCVCVGV